MGVFRTDGKGRCIFVNRRWCEIVGLSPEQAEGEGWEKFLHPEDRDRVAREWNEAAEKGLPFQSEYRFQRPDGKTIWVFGQADAEKDSSGKIIEYIGTITDISESKQAREDLQSTHLLLNAIRYSQSQCIDYLSKDKSKLIFDDLLSNILNFTQSEFGFIGEILHTLEVLFQTSRDMSPNVGK